MRRVVFVFVVLGAMLLSCQAVVGDLGGYTDSCSPIADRCPKGSPCVFDYGASQFKCQPHTGTKGQDVTCTSEDECAAGYACTQFLNNNSGHCALYCTDNSTCASGVDCIGFDPGRFLPSGAQAGSCGPLTTPCDPLAASSTCGSGKRCTLYDTDYTKCDTSEDMRAPNDPCDYISQCAQGSTCTAAGFCRQLCDFDAPSCPANTTCTDYATPRSLKGKHIGLCIPP